jgi:hypothetical protein
LTAVQRGGGEGGEERRSRTVGSLTMSNVLAGTNGEYDDEDVSNAI